MKKLNLKKIDFSKHEVLSRGELKQILGGNVTSLGWECWVHCACSSYYLVTTCGEPTNVDVMCGAKKPGCADEWHDCTCEWH